MKFKGVINAKILENYKVIIVKMYLVIFLELFWAVGVSLVSDGSSSSLYLFLKCIVDPQIHSRSLT